MILTTKEKLTILHRVIPSAYFRRIFVKIAMKEITPSPQAIGNCVYDYLSPYRLRWIIRVQLEALPEHIEHWYVIFAERYFRQLRERGLQRLDHYDLEYFANIGSLGYLDKKFPDNRHTLVEDNGQVFIIAKT